MDKRQRDAIIHKSDKNQEMRILVIYYIEMRARYFNAFVENIYAILTNINILYETEHREILNISAIAQQQTQWNKNITKKLLDILIEQADRNKTSSSRVKNYWYTVPPDTTEHQAVIAQSEKRFGLFPDDGLFEMFKHLPNKDIRAKMIAENERIKTFLQSIQNIMMTIDEIHRVEESEAKQAKRIDGLINKYIVSLSERFNSTSRLSSFLLLRSKKIAPKPIVSSVSDELAIDKKAHLLTQMFAYSQGDLIHFLTITDYVLQRLDTLSLYLVKTKNDDIRLSLVSICERRNEYIHKMRMLHIINGFNPKITTYPPTYTSVLLGYKGGRKKKKPKSITKDTKKKKPTTKPTKKPKPTRRIRLRFP
jgi:hypothetical protein